MLITGRRLAALGDAREAKSKVVAGSTFALMRGFSLGVEGEV